MRLFLISCVIVIATLFTFFNYSVVNFQSADYIKIAHGITNKVAKKLRDQKHLFLIGTGGGMMHDIQLMSMSFYYYEEVDLRESRNLIVNAIN